jgi:hypothetical protein
MLRWVGAAFSKADKQLYPSDKMFELEEHVRLIVDCDGKDVSCGQRDRRTWYKVIEKKPPNCELARG